MTAAPTLMAQRKLPWHNAATSLVDGLQTAEQALELAGLDWEIQLKPNHHNVYEGGKTIRKKSKAISVLRTDTWDEIGVVGKRYRTLSNKRSFRFLDELISGSGAKFEAAGCDKGGARVFIVVKLPAQVQVLGSDLLDQYVLFVTSHDGSLAVTASPALIRIRCTNMFRSMLSTKDTAVWKAQHLTTLEDKVLDVAAARRSLELVETGNMNFKHLVERLAKFEVHGEDGDNGFYELMKLGLPWEGSARDKLVEGIKAVWHTSDTVPNDLRNTGWGLLNATTEYMDHHREYRTSGSRFTNVAFTLGRTIERNLTRGLSRRAS